MRKNQQKQILEVLETIAEAQSAGLFADCQDCAIGVGEYIEQIEGEGTRTVELLEEYCELLFKASNGETDDNALKDHMSSIEDSVKTELKPNRIEIAFLSYIASMSDSIETIYLAAKADPDCDAFWIPIPYYDRNPDGSLGTMHCEGAESYGGGIECTDWHEYDIEARRPDVIFTFNPYDAENFVTSVHPDYYCERLRGLTEMLVYVPYFVVADDISEHFVLVPGCKYAHKVIIQSEVIRDRYVSIFKARYGDEHGKPEEKFLALGSPKFDKVINAKREDYELPSPLSDLIGGRKVILYNTTISAILAGGGQYLEKLRHVIETFRNSDEVALWWRPHPLSETTFESMRPELRKEYGKIVSDYKRAGLGIYDDTPEDGSAKEGERTNLKYDDKTKLGRVDEGETSNFIYDDTSDLYRAINFADAYYGDWSSLVPLFGVTGKPIVIQDVNSIESEVTLRFTGYFEDITNALIEKSLGNIASFFATAIPKEENINNERRDKYLETSANKNGSAGKSSYDYISVVVKGGAVYERRRE